MKQCWTLKLLRMKSGVLKKPKLGSTLRNRRMLIKKIRIGRTKNGQTKNGKNGMPLRGDQTRGPIKNGVNGNKISAEWNGYGHTGMLRMIKKVVLREVLQRPEAMILSPGLMSDITPNELLESGAAAATEAPTPMEGIEEEPEPEGDEEISDGEGSGVSFDETLEEFYEDPQGYEHLNGDDYKNYRFAMLGGAIGVEHWLVNKIKFFRIVRQHGLDHNDSREVWATDIQIKELMRMLAEIQVGEPSARTKVIRYLVAKTRYILQHGHQQETLSETTDPEGYQAAHYGFGGEAFVSS